MITSTSTRYDSPLREHLLGFWFRTGGGGGEESKEDEFTTSLQLQVRLCIDPRLGLILAKTELV